MVLLGVLGGFIQKPDHSGAPQSQEQRYRQDGIVNIDTAEPYDSLTMVSGDISRRAHGS
jgi:hypothetical protein